VAQTIKKWLGPEFSVTSMGRRVFKRDHDSAGRMD